MWMMAARPEKYSVKLERWTATTRGISKGFTIHVLESEHQVGETPSKAHWLARIDKSQVEQKANEQGFDLNVDGLLSILQSCLESSGHRPLLDVEECTVNVNKIPANDNQQSQQTPWAEFLEMPGHLDYSRSSRLAGQTYMPSPFDGNLEVSFRLIVRSAQREYSVPVPWKLYWGADDIGTELSPFAVHDSKRPVGP